jgi:hypothetical protein
MKTILNIICLTFLLNSGNAQKLSGQWNRTEKQIDNMTVKQELTGTWISSVNNHLLSFTLNADKTFSWTTDSLNFDLPDSLYWTKPVIRWTTIGDKFYIFTPGEEKNLWKYSILGVYYQKKDKLYIGCVENVDDLKEFIKMKEWKDKREDCVVELIKSN